jgi:glycosyltransferase 2 family protein
MFKNFNKWFIYISFGLTILLFYFFFRNVDFRNEWNIIRNANRLFIAIAGLLLIFSHYLRAIRWQILILPIYPHVRLFSCFLAFLAGTLSNFVFPHSGDLLRCGILKKIEKSPVNIILGTVILERFVDSILIFGLILIAFIGAFSNMNGLLKELDFFRFKVNTSSIFYLFSLFSFFLILFFLFRNSILLLSLKNKVTEFFESLKKGFFSFKMMSNKMYFSTLTMLIWFLYFLATGFLLWALPTSIPITYLAILAVLVMASLGWAGPTQGGIGAFHFLVAKTLLVFGLTYSSGVTFAIFLHVIFSVFDISFGLMALLFLKFLKENPELQKPNLIKI